MTLLEQLKSGINPKILYQVSEEERINSEKLMKAILKGRVVVMQGSAEPVAIGHLFPTRVNVNLGTSSSISDLKEELEKVKIAEKYGADTISDLSMGGNIDHIRSEILKISHVPITTVPIYQVMAESKSETEITDEKILRTIEKQVLDGVSSIVIHAGFTLKDLQGMKGKRIMGMVSKGGSFTASYMVQTSLDNPFIQNFDEILEILNSKDVVLNLGNAMRSGCIHDRIDDFHIAEMQRNVRLAKIANSKGVQVILEGLGGHVFANDLIKWTKKYKKLTQNRPLFVSGPLPTDYAVGYDHIAASIGAALTSGFGADYLCAITPAEHLGLPNADDIKQGLIAAKIAAHIGDSMKFGLNRLFQPDLEVSKNRFLRNWKNQFENSLDPEEPLKKHVLNSNECTMCGKYCALAISKRIFD